MVKAGGTPNRPAMTLSVRIDNPSSARSRTKTRPTLPFSTLTATCPGRSIPLATKPLTRLLSGISTIVRS